jgi:hypothetical protein
VVLVAFVLVLLAAVSFAAGIAASRTSDALVYLSIAFSLAAFVMLAIASFRARQARRDAPVDEFVAAPTRPLDETEAHAGPLLGGLDPTQLDMTPTWRRQGRRRPAPEPVVTDEDEDLDAELENEEDEADLEVPVKPVAAGRAPDQLWWGRDEGDQDETAAFDVSLHEFEEEEEHSALDLPVSVSVPEPEPDEDAEGSFYDQYDDLTAAEILPFLRALDLEGLEWVRDRERSGAKRATVVNQVEQLILEHGGRASTSTRKRSTTKRAAKKAAPARRSTKKSTRRR